MLGKSVGKNSFILALFALATAAILAVTYQGTAARIAAEEKKAAERALLELLPEVERDTLQLGDTLTLPLEQSRQLGLSAPAVVHIAKSGARTLAFIVPAVAPDGYSGAIKLLIGIFVDGSLSGVRVLSHRETPGLGDKIETKKSPWIRSFRGKSLTHPEEKLWAVKKEGGVFDQFTGATITPRAVVNQVKQTLAVYRDNPQLFFPQSPPQGSVPNPALSPTR